MLKPAERFLLPLQRVKRILQMNRIEIFPPQRNLSVDDVQHADIRFLAVLNKQSLFQPPFVRMSKYPVVRFGV